MAGVYTRKALLHFTSRAESSPMAPEVHQRYTCKRRTRVCLSRRPCTMNTQGETGPGPPPSASRRAHPSPLGPFTTHIHQSHTGAQENESRCRRRCPLPAPRSPLNPRYRTPPSHLRERNPPLPWKTHTLLLRMGEPWRGRPGQQALGQRALGSCGGMSCCTPRGAEHFTSSSSCRQRGAQAW